CRPCWRRASTAWRRRPSASCRPLRSLAGRCLCRCSRPLPSCLQQPCIRVWRTSRRRSFCMRRHLVPEPAYTFKHALTHEVAYDSLLLERRRGLHTRLVEALEALTPARAAEVAAGAQGLPAGRQDPGQVDRLAYHALRGEVWDKAVTYCQQAG